MRSLTSPEVTAEVQNGGIVITGDAELTIALKSAGVSAEVAKAAGFTLDKSGENIVTAIAIPSLRSIAGAQALIGKLEPATPKPASGKDERTDEQKADGLLDFANYAIDLLYRRIARAEVLSKLESPETAINKGVKGLMAAVPGMAAEAARDIIGAQRKAANLP